MTYPLDVFFEYAKEMDHSPQFTEEVEKYVSSLLNRNLPVFFSLPHLALAASFSINHVERIVKSNRRDYYKRFKLAKRRGGFRIIQTPDQELKYLQKWILLNILNKVNSHPACKGFDPKSSIILNAQDHLNKEAILKIDLLRFFDSINEKRIYGVFKGLGYHPNLAVSLAKLCTLKPDNTFFIAFKKNELMLKELIKKRDEGILPQGAPTSPKLSNLIARNLDIRLDKLCKKHGISYTRYADDLTFSGEKTKLMLLKKVVYKIVKTEGFYINYGKTKFLTRGNKYFVTGLSVHNKTLKVPRKKKLDIEHHLHHCLKNGVHVHMIKSKIKNRNFKDWLLGSICFVWSVEQELGQKYFDEYNKIEWPV
ncbi:reverse transcriptase family protein [Chitinophaga niabensis]|uniref:RNA-directed DNA polymerase n=1 Tax=Chitinophaga niabensis TaxID=536979 RepID=A0A1N6FJH0_9BACT|nr:reverse transcriptase family protein [Chitinophaga niabensis]SIN95384.1 RNA-directed DNA polymerase [Chitinophaga niabensis]